MNTIIAFFTELVITFGICLLTFGYLKPFLRRILVDLCGSEERAQFWTAFSSIILIGLPILLALMYQPASPLGVGLFFELTRRVSGNLMSFMFALVGIGLIVSFFALVAPRAKAES